MTTSVKAILTACEEVALGVIGSTEVVAAGTLVRNAWAPDEVGAPARAFVSPRVEVEIQGPGDTGLIPRSSNKAALAFDVLVRCTYSTTFELDDDGRRAARAFAIETTELVRAALTRPANVIQTSVGVLTELCGGCLIKAVSKTPKADFKKRLIVVEIVAKALVYTSRAAIPAAPVISAPGGVLTGQTIVWSAVSATPAVTSYRLYRNGVLVGTVTSPYIILSGDIGPALTVTAVNAAGESVPSNALQAAASLDLSAGGTFTRSTEGSYLTGAPTDGSVAFLAWALANARRIENRGDGLGAMLLMEGSRTNRVLRSRDMLGANWSLGNGGTTGDQNGGPDAAGLADQGNVATAQIANYCIQNGLTTQQTGSVWRRAVSGTALHQMMLAAGPSLTAVVAKALLATTTWSRIDAQAASFPGSAGYSPCDGRDQTAVGGQAATAQNVYLDLHQLESGAFPSSAIRVPTASPATRGADALSYPTGSYPVSLLSSGLRVVAAPDASSADVVTDTLDMRLVQVGANDYVRIRATGGVCKVELVCGGSIVAAQTVTFSRYQALTIDAHPSTGSITIAGATTGNGTVTGAGAAWAATATLYIGTDSAGANGYFGRLGTSLVML